MNDLEKLQNIFRELEIEYTMSYEDSEYPQVLQIDEGIGYDGFLAAFNFDKDGKFINYGVWE